MTGNVQLYLPGPCVMDWMGAPLVGFVRPVKRRTRRLIDDAAAVLGKMHR